MGMGDARVDVEPDCEPALPGRKRVRCLLTIVVSVEEVEQVWSQSRWDTGTVVPHRYRDPVAVSRPHLDLDIALLRIPHGVRQEVRKHLPEAHVVPGDRQGFRSRERDAPTIQLTDDIR